MIAPLWLAGMLVVFVAWCLYDAKAAFDRDPDTHSASEFIKRWVRAAPWFRLLVALLLVNGATYLILHLVLQVV